MPQASTAKKPAIKAIALKTPVAKAKKPAPKKVEPVVNGADLKVGSKAPDFKLPTAAGEVSLAKLKGKAFVLYFYPKDDTSGCTAEACGFRDAIPVYAKLGLTVIGVSKDNLASHEKFAKKFGLNFGLASDESGKTCEAYGVWIEKSMYGKKYMGLDRATFLIDGSGVIRALWRHVSVPGHVEYVRRAAAEL
jgi:peroxiredoxin Q/BCP